MDQLRFWFILQQDVDRPVGGVKQIYSVASIIADLGFSVFIVQGTSDFRPSWFKSSLQNIRTIADKDFLSQTLATDIVVIPKLFYLCCRSFHLSVVIFNQNMHYLFGEKLNFDPSAALRLYSLPNILSVLTVISDYIMLWMHCLCLLLEYIEL